MEDVHTSALRTDTISGPAGCTPIFNNKQTRRKESDWHP